MVVTLEVLELNEKISYTMQRYMQNVSNKFMFPITLWCIVVHFENIEKQ